MILVPGSCYLYAGVYPNVRSDFLLAGALLTIMMVALATWRFLAPDTTASALHLSIFAQGFTLALLLICAQFWMAYSALSAVPIVLALLVAYALAWIIPYRAPAVSQGLYRELYFPKSAAMRFLTKIVFALGGAAALLGMRLSRMGRLGWLILAVSMTTGLLIAGFYFAAQFWRIGRGKNPVPSPEE